MGKTKLEKHLEELEESTSGGSKDAVTFAGKGLNVLRDLFKSSKKEDDEDDKEIDDEDDDEDEEEEEEGKKAKKNANGGDLEEEDEDDLDDPGDEDNDIISNKGKRTPKDKLKNAVSKNVQFDERRFAKSFDEDGEYAEAIDVEPLLGELTEHIRTLGKSANATQSQVGVLGDQNLILAKAVKELLKSNAAMASDLELIKKQPATSPASGFVVITKNEGGKERKLTKSDIQDVITEELNQESSDFETLNKSLKKLGVARTKEDLQAVVEMLPADLQGKL